MATMTDKKPLQSTTEVGDNPLGLSQEVTSKVVAALNQDLASLYALYHQTKKHHWIVEGAERQEIHLLLDKHSEYQLEFADEIAERINDLGGIPVSGMRAQEECAYIQVEPEGLFELREMLYNDISAYTTIVTKLRQHITLTTNRGDFGTEELLKRALYRFEAQANDLHDHMADETLVMHPKGND